MNYGYSFTDINSDGLGAIIYSILLAKKYCLDYSYNFYLTKEGYEIPRFNGSIDDDVLLENKNWHSYFDSFSIIDKKDINNSWPSLNENTKLKRGNINLYRYVLQNHVFILKNDIIEDIEKRVKKTPFNKDSDIVLHIRKTDKINDEVLFELNDNIYINDTEYVINKYFKNKEIRIYICTDYKPICLKIKEYFNKKNVEVVWDETESDESLQYIRWSEKMNKTVAQEETMNALKNLYIMKDGLFLIGGRMSYFYRIAELLRNDKCFNSQDNDLFGNAEYSDDEYLVRPCKKKQIVNFINNNIDYESYNNTYLKYNRVVIKNFINYDTAKYINKSFESYNKNWWSYAIMPNENIWKPLYLNINDPLLNYHFNNCEKCLNNKLFSYRFKRIIGNHYDTCNCITCYLNNTLTNQSFIETLEKISGLKALISNEINISYYSKDDFINIHADQNKGDFAITLSFTDDWHSTYGGLLNFCDNNDNIIETLIPSLGTLCMFKIIDGKSKHFVSKVNVDKNRYVISAWYSSLYK